ncbi:MAG: HIT family protein [Promethearchaeota archaeon]
MRDYNYYNNNYIRYKLDVKKYNERAQTGPCFICEILKGNPKYPAHIVYQDEEIISFLDAYPRLYGWTLVAPKKHKEGVVLDFNQEDYLSIQSKIYTITKAIIDVLKPKRIYILSLGSHQGNSHVHWHIVPLPSGMPYDDQQNGVFKLDILKIPEEEQIKIASELNNKIQITL